METTHDSEVCERCDSLIEIDRIMAGFTRCHDCDHSSSDD